MANLEEITAETRHILAKTDISKTAIRKSEENVSHIINMSSPFQFDVNKQDEDRTSLVNMQMEQYYQTTWLISFLLPNRMRRTKLMSLLNNR